MRPRRSAALVVLLLAPLVAVAAPAGNATYTASYRKR
jgi:hypothetical protein